jgi:DNA-binding transcriptional LysR family regulator
MHLRYARAVAQEGSFSGAARACSVTQPALSNGIAVLERGLGGRLFDRSTRGVTITPLGERVLPLIEHALRGLDAVVSEARLASRSERRPLRVGVSSVVDRDLVGRVFEAAGALGFDHDVTLRSAAVGELRRSLTQADLDLLVYPAGAPDQDLRRATVAEVPMVFLAPGAGDTPAGTMVDRSSGAEGPIELHETTAVPVILPSDACGLAPFTRALFAANDLPLPTYPGQAHDCRMLQDWVALGLGAALLPASKVADGIPHRPVCLHDVPVTIAYEARWLTDSPLRTEITHIVDTLASTT